MSCVAVHYLFLVVTIWFCCLEPLMLQSMLSCCQLQLCSSCSLCSKPCEVMLLCACADANDAAQFAELKTQGDLTRRAWERDVQVSLHHC